jgi:patatin-related protein
MKPYENGPDSFEWEELRLGLVMNGGVSLAVWMGGVSNEIFRLVTHQHPVYRGLMELTRTSARVDVISGTSAGGVNGAALALALLYGGDFSCLRDVWMNTGAFTDLLRPPLGKNPGSLLQGEEYFLPGIQGAFTKLAAGAQAPKFEADVMPIDLRLTTTLLSGHQGRNVDDLGQPVHDVDYRANFRFERCTGQRVVDAPRDVFSLEKDDMVAALARAARSTSSFPFAFEPSLVSDDAGEWLFTKNDAKLQSPRYVIDGGIMDNKPLRGAREAVFKMPRHGSVRRVIAYVNPDPGDGKPFDPPVKPKMPDLAPVLAAAIIGIPQSQSISDELKELEEHNLKVRMRRESAVNLASAYPANDEALREMAQRLFGIYRTRRLAATFESFVYQPLSDAASRQPKFAKALSAVGKYGKETMKQAFVTEAGSLGDAGYGWLPDTWPKTACDASNTDSVDWAWGLFPVEFASKLVMNILRMMQSLMAYRSPAKDGKYTIKGSQPTGATTDGDWFDNGELFDAEGLNAHLKSLLEPSFPGSARLADLWRRAYSIVNAILSMRHDEARLWRCTMDAALEKLAALTRPVSAEALTQWNAETVHALFAHLVKADRRSRCARMAYELASITQDAVQVANDVCTPRPDAPTMLASETAVRESMKALQESFKGLTQKEVVYKFLQMEVAEFAFNDHDSLSTDTFIELVQISGNSESPVGGPDCATDKLLGLQLAHFGAFYKESWRANDWTFGRLDGSMHLVAALLNPKRLHQIYFGPDGALSAALAISDIAKNSVCVGPLKDYLEREWHERQLLDRIMEELQFLDDRRHPSPCENVPDRLPCCEMAIGLRLHMGILRQELLPLQEAIIRDQSNGADKKWSSQALLDNLATHATNQATGGRSSGPRPAQIQPQIHLRPEIAANVLRAGLLAGPNQRGESFRKEAGSDLFTRTLAHTIATLQNTLSSKHAKLGPVAVLFAGLRLPAVGFHFVAEGLTRQSRTAAALHSAMLMVGLTLVLMSLMSNRPLEGAIIQFGWLILAFSLTVSIVRAPFVFLVVLIVAFVGSACWAIFSGAQAVALPILLMLASLMVSVRFPTMQWLVGLVAIGIAAYLSAGVIADPPSLKLAVYQAAGLCIVGLIIALLDACGALRPLNERLRHAISKRS